MPPLSEQLVEKMEAACAGFDMLQGAVEQLEKGFGGLERKVSSLPVRGGFDRDYKGAFLSEDQARGFALFMAANAPDANLRQHAAAMMGSQERAAMDSVGDASLIPTEYSSRIKKLVDTYGVFRRNAFVMPMSEDTLVFIKSTGDVTVTCLSENTAPSDTKPSVANCTLNCKEFGALTYFPRTLEEDALASVGEIIADSMARGFALKEDQLGFLGDGTVTYHGIVGVIQRLKNVSADITNPTDGSGLVKASGNAWSEIALADFEKLQAVLPEYASRNARWVVHRRFWHQVMRKLALAAQGATASDIIRGAEKYFLGDPVEIVQVMPSAEANSQICALYGDLKLAATLGDRRKMKVESSPHYKWAERQITMLGTERVAFSVEDVGTASAAGPIVGLITAAS